MGNISQEIVLIRNEIVLGFVDPFRACDLKEFLLGPSKMIRSQIALLFLKSLSVEISQDLVKILASGEIVHNASLLHDDILDNAKSRRGMLTIGEKYSSKMAILSGDYLLTLAMKKLLEIDNKQIVDLFCFCTEQMVLSEIRQFQLRDQNTLLEEYIDICKNKTGLLFATILESCAVVANIDINLAKKIGLLFGIVFQIKNDMEELSARQDKLNKIETAIDILGVEKTKNLLDNYHKEIMLLLATIPDNDYRIRLEDLINNYV